MGIFLGSSILKSDTTSWGLKRMGILTFDLETKVIPTLSWKDLMSSIVILIEMFLSPYLVMITPN